MPSWLIRLVFSQKRRLAMYERLARYLENGFSDIKSLEKLKASAMMSKSFASKVMVKVYEDAILRIRSAKHASIGHAFYGYIPSDEFMLITASQGDTVSALRNVIHVTRISRELRMDVAKRLATPVVSLIVLMGLIVFTGLMLMPQMLDITPLEKWPSDARALYDFSTAFTNYLHINIVLMILSIMLLFISFNKWSGQYRVLADRYIPMFSLYRDIAANLFLVSLSSQLKNNISFKAAIENLAENSSNYLKWHLTRILMNIRASKSESIAMDTGLLNEQVSIDVRDYAELTNFGDAIEKIASELSNDTKNKVLGFSIFISAIALAASGGIALWILSAMSSFSSVMKNSM